MRFLKSSIVKITYNYKGRQMVKTKKNIQDIKVDVPEGHSGDWRIEKFTVDDDAAMFHNIRATFSFGGGGRDIQSGTYTRLVRGKGDIRTFGGATVVMSDTPAEIRDHSYFVHKAKDNVLINGLGLGWIVEALFQKKEVKTIVVVEKSKDVIDLVKQHYYDKCPKDKYIIIVHADALEFKPQKGQRFGAVWHDIWDNICADNLEDMKKLHRKYGRHCDWQGSWCREECEQANRRW